MGWEEFFRKELVPAAQRGLHTVHLETGVQWAEQEQPYIALGGTMAVGKGAGNGNRTAAKGKGKGKGTDGCFLSKYFPGLTIEDVIQVARKHGIQVQALSFGTY